MIFMNNYPIRVLGGLFIIVVIRFGNPTSILNKVVKY